MAELLPHDVADLDARLEALRRSELIVFDRAGKKLIPIEPKWKDESYTDVRWLKNGELRVLRRDRLRR